MSMELVKRRYFNFTAPAAVADDEINDNDAYK